MQSWTHLYTSREVIYKKLRRDNEYYNKAGENWNRTTYLPLSMPQFMYQSALFEVVVVVVVVALVVVAAVFATVVAVVVAELFVVVVVVVVVLEMIVDPVLVVGPDPSS